MWSMPVALTETENGNDSANQNGCKRFWDSRYEKIAPLDLGSCQGLEIILRDIVNLLK